MILLDFQMIWWVSSKDHRNLGLASKFRQEISFHWISDGQSGHGASHRKVALWERVTVSVAATVAVLLTASKASQTINHLEKMTVLAVGGLQ